jgi:hypothetical protein
MVSSCEKRSDCPSLELVAVEMEPESRCNTFSTKDARCSHATPSPSNSEISSARAFGKPARNCTFTEERGRPSTAAAFFNSNRNAWIVSCPRPQQRL